MATGSIKILVSTLLCAHNPHHTHCYVNCHRKYHKPVYVVSRHIWSATVTAYSTTVSLAGKNRCYQLSHTQGQKHTHTHTDMHTYTHTQHIYIVHTHALTHTHAHTHTHTHVIHTYTHIHKHTHTYTHIHTYTHTFTLIHTHITLTAAVMTPSLSDVGSILTVNVEPSDDAFGRFGFAPNSLSRVVVEQSGGTPVTLTVTRLGGQFGDVSVYWSVSQSGGVSGSAMDISPSGGVLEFVEGQNQMDILLTVNDDLVCLWLCLTPW